MIDVIQSLNVNESLLFDVGVGEKGGGVRKKLRLAQKKAGWQLNPCHPAACPAPQARIFNTHQKRSLVVNNQ